MGRAPRPKARSRRRPTSPLRGDAARYALRVDNQQFVASLVSSLAWPVAVVIVAFVFHDPIGQMIGRLEHVKSPIFEAWTKAEAATLSAVAASPTPPPSTPVEGSLSRKLALLAATSPGGAVAMGWMEVEKVLRGKMEGMGLPFERVAGVRGVEEAFRAGVINEATASAIRGLANLRNMVVHGGADDLDSARALDYLAMADGVIFAIEHGKPEHS